MKEAKLQPVLTRLEAGSSISRAKLVLQCDTDLCEPDRPILEAAGFHLDVRETKDPGHATVIMKEAELQPVCREATYHSCVLIKIDGRRARQTFVGHVRPILEAAGFHLDVRETKGPGHATDIVKEAELQIFDAVVAVGGDGTIFEILQVQPRCCLVPAVSHAGAGQGSSAILAHSITARVQPC